jgi:putative SOS response-associated peptidase YedK
MPVDECPNDDECRQTYNFPPGAIGIVYRADVPDYGAGPSTKYGRKKLESEDREHQPEAKQEAEADAEAPPPSLPNEEVHYKLQSMKWGLVPSWSKRAPDYSSVMRTINARDDSLMENRGIWNVPKRRKRCIVIAQGFYECLKKNNGKERIPHYIKRKDNQLMCFAGLWDCVKYEGMYLSLATYGLYSNLHQTLRRRAILIP